MGRLMYGRLALLIALFYLFPGCAGVSIESARTRGVYHRIKQGQTLNMIARAYHVSVLDLAVVNSIDDPDFIETDQVIFIPGASQVVEDVGTIAREDGTTETVALKAEGAERRPSAGRDGADVAEISPQSSEKPPAKTPPVAERSKAAQDSQPLLPERSVSLPQTAVKQQTDDKTAQKQRFVWPVNGRVTSRFGRQPDGTYCNGIDIAVQEGESVAAAADGKVTFSAYLKDYGETIIIQHEDHFSTVYTHLGRRMTQQQDHVKKGERIAVVGKPGGQRDAYLNFGIWYKYKARDPLVFLP